MLLVKILTMHSTLTSVLAALGGSIIARTKLFSNAATVQAVE